MTMTETGDAAVEGRRRRGGGADARRARRQGARADQLRFVTRRIPIYEVLSEEGLSLIEDFRNFVKLAYRAPALHHSGGTVCEPVDVPVNKRHLDMVHAHIRWSDKPFMGSVTHPERAADSVEMCRLVFGEGFVDENCVMVSLINVNSPMVYD